MLRRRREDREDANFGPTRTWTSSSSRSLSPHRSQDDSMAHVSAKQLCFDILVLRALVAGTQEDELRRWQSSISCVVVELLPFAQVRSVQTEHVGGWCADVQHAHNNPSELHLGAKRLRSDRKRSDWKIARLQKPKKRLEPGGCVMSLASLVTGYADRRILAHRR